MFPGGELQPVEKFIGNSVFGLTLLSIQEVLDKLKKELLEVNSALAQTKENFSRQFPTKDIAKQQHDIAENIRLRNEAILEVSPEEILKSLQEIYNVIIGFEKEGLSRKDILSKIKKERPNLLGLISKYYAILRTQNWGYSLGHKLLGFRLREESF